MVVQVDETGHDDPVGGIEDLGARRLQVLADRQDPGPVEQDVSALDDSQRARAQLGVHREDQPRIADQDGPALLLALRFRGRWRDE
jgi:hypothetical protein